jgi:hypothetical protein
MVALQLASKQRIFASLRLAKIVTLQLVRSFESLQVVQLAAPKVLWGSLNLPCLEYFFFSSKKLVLSLILL